MTVQNAAAALLIILPLAFNLFFFLLGRRFDYPNILRSPTGEVLSRFKAGGVGLKLLWYGFMLTAVLLSPLAVLLGQVRVPRVQQRRTAPGSRGVCGRSRREVGP
jgi:hypothetical protein